MKVKLLKKIRKRYSITRIDKLASNASDFHKDAKKSYGLPFFILEDKHEYSIRYFETYDEAIEKLTIWINNDYKEKFRHVDGESSKVWYK